MNTRMQTELYMTQQQEVGGDKMWVVSSKKNNYCDFFERKVWAIDKAKILKSFGWKDVVVKPL